MNKNSKYVLIALTLAVTGIFTGCKSSEKQTTQTSVESSEKAATTVEESELSSASEGASDSAADLKKMFEDYAGLIGEKDDKVVALLGEGIIVPEKNEEVSLRSYEMKIFGSDAATDVFYDQGKISGFQIAVMQSDFESYASQMTDALGEPILKEEKTGESDKQLYKWNLSGCDIELVMAYDTVAIQMFKQQ